MIARRRATTGRGNGGADHRGWSQSLLLIFYLFIWFMVSINFLSLNGWASTSVWQSIRPFRPFVSSSIRPSWGTSTIGWWINGCLSKTRRRRKNGSGISWVRYFAENFLYWIHLALIRFALSACLIGSRIKILVESDYGLGKQRVNLFCRTCNKMVVKSGSFRRNIPDQK